MLFEAASWQGSRNSLRSLLSEVSVDVVQANGMWRRTCPSNLVLVSLFQGSVLSSPVAAIVDVRGGFSVRWQGARRESLSVACRRIEDWKSMGPFNAQTIDLPHIASTPHPTAAYYKLDVRDGLNPPAALGPGVQRPRQDVPLPQ